MRARFVAKPLRFVAANLLDSTQSCAFSTASRRLLSILLLRSSDRGSERRLCTEEYTRQPCKALKTQRYEPFNQTEPRENDGAQPFHNSNFPRLPFMGIMTTPSRRHVLVEMGALGEKPPAAEEDAMRGVREVSTKEFGVVES